MCTHVTPVNGIPIEDVPVNMPSHSIDAVEMTEVGNKQADEQSAPDFQIRCCAQDQSFGEGKTKIEVRQLHENDLGGDGYPTLGARSGMCEIEISLLLEGRVVGADDGGDGFDVEEEVLVETPHFTVRRCRHRGKWPSTPSRRLDNSLAG